MIVVAIIGLLSAIALPAFEKSRNSTRLKICVTNLKHIEAVKWQWALETHHSNDAVPSESDLAPYLYASRFPSCPANGTYRIRRVSLPPVCSLYQEGHTLNSSILGADVDSD